MSVNRLCTVNGCDKRHYARDYCHKHYQQWRRTDTSSSDFSPCSVDECDRRRYVLGYCSAHYQRYQKTGNPGPAEIAGETTKTCAVNGCGEKYACRGYCRGHYARWQRNGDPQGDVPFRNPDRTITYGSAHVRVYKERGPANQHLCHHCQTEATDWAYDGTDPNEIVGPGRGPYSLDVNRYIPLCKSCHCALDADRHRRIDHAKCIELYLSGINGPALAREFRCTTRGIYYILESAGVTIRGRLEWRDGSK